MNFYIMLIKADDKLTDANAIYRFRDAVEEMKHASERMNGNASFHQVLDEAGFIHVENQLMGVKR